MIRVHESDGSVECNYIRSVPEVICPLKIILLEKGIMHHD